jgi:hypothetical protein
MNNVQDLSVFSAVFRRLLFAPGFSRWEKGNTLLRTKPASAGLLDPLQQRRGRSRAEARREVALKWAETIKR